MCPNYRDCLYTDTVSERERGGVWTGTYLAMSEVRSSHVQSTPHVPRPQRLTHTHCLSEPCVPYPIAETVAITQHTLFSWDRQGIYNSVDTAIYSESAAIVSL